ncbi:MAG: tRNA uridine-5-carboxymethylaminomethyl(34) synthesis GTPase MnmE [Armatimonadetes bacterium]|nr:tRNA uridine-5-carboxymethylaminomethyl(34) synthesis GTPase MnmE [Armatimonadota bacterium]MDE2205389.1 tRNA uridine-5-carboxymethylaminomethyl(34) synthesis GTPase MnmE [Armatimonadota bacterium]
MNGGFELRLSDTIAAIATPPGAGAIAVIRVSGPATPEICDRVLAPRVGPAFSRSRARYARLVTIAAGESALVIDTALATLFRAPRSYTGEHLAEISCHGGRVVPQSVLSALLAAGARAADPGEFTLRAFLAGRVDLAQAEAVASLIGAGTEAAARAAHAQLDGALSRTVSAARNSLLDIAAQIEAAIDFQDEAGDFEHESVARRLQQTGADLAALLETARYGAVLRDGIRIAIVGRPNAGKSSLLNLLAQRSRAIVTPIAGTTRDTIEQEVNLHDLPATLVDTAGIRATENAVEAAGVNRARSELSHCSVALAVCDISGPCGVEDEAIVKYAAASAPAVVVALNKVDIAGHDHGRQTAGRVADWCAAARPVCVSALTGEGRTELITAIAEASYGGHADERPDGALILAERHRLAVARAAAAVGSAQQTCLAGMPADFIAIDLRGALDALGEVTGEAASEDIIERIFRNFCIGK